MKIIPSILVQSEEEFKKNIAGLGDAVDMIQVDIADGRFVPNTTWADPDVIGETTDLDIELHLMVQDPLQVLTTWKHITQVKRILVHIESVADFSDILPTLHTYGWDIGIVLNADTPTTMIAPYLGDIQVVMFMGVIAGKQGQPFIPNVLEKIRMFKTQNTRHLISIDGGVNFDTLPAIIDAGVDIIAPGSAIFKNEHTPEENVAHMYRLIEALV